MDEPRAARLGFWSGVGLVVGNMIGVGVLTSTGFMARDLSPAAILAAWALGGVAAMAGARAYAALAEMLPRSGGEYRYLSDLVHPSVGYLAGWTSVLVGFTAPIAVSAVTAGSFAETIAPRLEPRLFGAALIVAMTAAHALDLSLSKWAQNALVLLKVALLGGFVILGLAVGARAWPRWSPPAAHGPFPVEPFMISLVYIAYAYSGWNTAVYAADEFRDARRTVPRALLVGTGLVTLFYVVVNFVFVANLAPERLAAWSAGDTARVTVGHLLVRQLAGPIAGRVLSAVVILSLASSVSAMTLVGPRIARAMALEGYLPRAFAGRDGRPPTASVLLQSAIAVALVLTHSFELLLRNVGAILTLTSATTVLALLRAQFGKTPLPKPGAAACVAAVVFLVPSAWMLWFAFRHSPWAVAWVAATALVALGAWAVSSRRRRR